MRRVFGVVFGPMEAEAEDVVPAFLWPSVDGVGKTDDASVRAVKLARTVAEALQLPSDPSNAIRHRAVVGNRDSCDGRMQACRQVPATGPRELAC